MTSKIQTLIFMGLVLTSFSVQARDEVVFETTVRLPDLERQTLPGIDPQGVEFVANLKEPELGRAWVILHYPTQMPKDDSGPSLATKRIVVPDLGYDAAKKEIYFHSKSGERTICASHVEGSFWHTQRYDLGPECELTTAFEMSNLDDGFYTHRELAAHIRLTVRQP